MTVEEALKLIDIDFSEIIRDTSEETSEYVVFGSYKGEQIDVTDEGVVFVVCLGIGRKNYRINKSTGKVEEFRIFVAY